MSKLYLGIDPGRTGAACLVDREGRIIESHQWCVRQRQRRRVLLVDSEHVLRTSACLGRFLARSVAPDFITVESQFVSKNARTGLTLSRTAGMTVAELLASAVEGGTDPDDVVKWMLPNQWRRLVWGDCGRLTREEWKRKAVEEFAAIHGREVSEDEAEAYFIAMACVKANQ
jgi:Holliday junction resolvasome RuvABC endonuclease subunit